MLLLFPPRQPKRRATLSECSYFLLAVGHVSFTGYRGEEAMFFFFFVFRFFSAALHLQMQGAGGAAYTWRPAQIPQQELGHKNARRLRQLAKSGLVLLVSAVSSSSVRIRFGVLLALNLTSTGVEKLLPSIFRIRDSRY